MKRRSLLALALVLATAACVGAADGPDSFQGKPAPDIALKDLAGKDLKLSDQKGKVVLVDMWATWCPPCRQSLPHVQSMATDKALAAKGLVVWAVNAREDKDAVQKFLADNKYTFTVPMDTNGDVLKAYKVSGIPTTVIVGRDGNVKNVFVGFGDGSAKEIDAAVEKALAEPTPN